MANTKKTVAFAEDTVTVHRTLSREPGVLPDGSEAWDIESVILTSGQTLPLADMPPYQVELVTSGKVPGLIALTPAQAKRVEEAYAQQMGIGTYVSAEQESDPDFPAEEF